MLRLASAPMLLSLLASARILDVRDFGAVPDNETDCTEAFHLSMKDAEPGDIVFVPGRIDASGQPGSIYATGAFNISSGVELHVEAGAVILGHRDPSAYPYVAPMPSYNGSRDYAGDPNSPDGGRWMRHHPLVWAVDAVGVRITGGGVIDGQGDYWYNKYRHNDLLAGRPHAVEFRNCTDVEVTGVTIQNSGFWSLHILYTRGAWIHDMKVFTPWGSINGDGIDPDSSQDVLIERCYIATGDDHIAIKSGLDEAGKAFGMPSRNITIRDCFLGHGRGIAIGSEVSGGVEDVHVSRVVVDENSVEAPGWGFYIKSAPSRGAFVRRITFEHCVLGNVEGSAFAIWTSYPSASDKRVPARKLTEIRDIAYRNITGLHAEYAGDWECWDERHCENITIEDVRFKNQDTIGWNCENVTGVAHNVVPPISLDCFLGEAEDPPLIV